MYVVKLYPVAFALLKTALQNTERRKWRRGLAFVTWLFSVVLGGGLPELDKGINTEASFSKTNNKWFSSSHNIKECSPQHMFSGPSVPHTQKQSYFLDWEQLENGVYKNQGVSFGGHTAVLKQRCLWLRGPTDFFPLLMCILQPLWQTQHLC